MSLMNEALARAHCSERLAAAESERLARRALKERRAARRAERPVRRSGLRAMRKAIAARN